MRFPLRLIRHAARASDRSCFMTFETDSETDEPLRNFIDTLYASARLIAQA
jgi:hypothetical protein